jgi:hypothetical protein
MIVRFSVDALQFRGNGLQKCQSVLEDALVPRGQAAEGVGLQANVSAF